MPPREAGSGASHQPGWRQPGDAWHIPAVHVGVRRGAVALRLEEGQVVLLTRVRRAGLTP
jgi:hypothetical protein